MLVMCMQVIEKALKKLKLDAMIIQQGRLSDNKASVNKDDLLSMVRYGAEMVFSGGGAVITDEDIDAIIAKVCSAMQQCFRNVWCAIPPQKYDLGAHLTSTVQQICTGASQSVHTVQAHMHVFT